MKRCLIVRLSVPLLLTCFLAAQERHEGQKMSDREIAQKVSRFLRWSWYWDAYPLDNYAEDKRVEMSIVESPKDVAVFLADVGMSIVFDFNGKIIGGRIFPPTTNSAAVDKYVDEYGVAFGNMGPGVNTNPVLGRMQTLTTEEKAKILKVRSIPFSLPRLTPPDSIRLRLKSPELPR